jgi:hypothetical protein
MYGFRFVPRTIDYLANELLKLKPVRLEECSQDLSTEVVVFTGSSDISDLGGDLKRLGLVFEHIEKLLILAASVHRKLIDAPRLAQAIFTDYFNYYLPKMGTTLESICYEKVNARFFVPENAMASTLVCYSHLLLFMNTVGVFSSL